MKTLKEILKEELLTEAIKIDDAEDAVNLIKNKKIGVKVQPGYLMLNDMTLKNSINTFIDNLNKFNIKDIVYGIQLLVSKVPSNELQEVINQNAIYEIIKNKNKPWAKPLINNVISKPYNKDEWNNLEKSLQNESGNHGKANKGSGDKKEVKTLYEDGTWGLYIPLSYEGEKAIAYYGKKDEKQTPCEWCTRVEKHYYDTYTFNNTKPMYVIRNYNTGKTYQFAYDKNEVYFLDQNDREGDEITSGDLSSIPDNLLKLIKINNKTLLDFKKEMSRTSPKKGEINNPQVDFQFAEWSKPKEENGITTQYMTNLSNKEQNSKFTRFLLDNKSVKFDKKNNYLKKYYYKNNPNYFVTAILSKNGNVSDDFFYAFKKENNNYYGISKSELNQAVKDNGKLYNTAYIEYKDSKLKRKIRSSNKMESGTKNYIDRMDDKLTDYLRKKFKNYFGYFTVESVFKGLKLNKDSNEYVNAGNFLPIKIYIDFKNNFEDYSLLFLKHGNKYKIDKNDEDTKKVFRDFNIENDIDKIETNVNEAVKEFSREAIHDKVGQNRRVYFRGREKGAINYNRSTSSNLQFEDYFPY